MQLIYTTYWLLY